MTKMENSQNGNFGNSGFQFSQNSQGKTGFENKEPNFRRVRSEITLKNIPLIKTLK